MGAKQFPNLSGRRYRWMTRAIMIAACCAGTAAAQSTSAVRPAAGNPVVQTAASPSAPDGTPMASSGILQTGCSSCGGGVNLPGLPGGSCGNGCGEGCVPGRFKQCDGGTCSDTWPGRLVHGLTECLCCPDPCYEPRWLAVADSAFFVDAARPQTQMSFRWDHGWDVTHPDRAEYFWAREGVNQAEPSQPGSRHGFGKGPRFIAGSVDYEDLSLYIEGATGGAGLFIETPYRELDPTASGISSAPALNASGFGDLNVGTKSMLLDCELMQVTFQFKTFILTGDFTKGLGTGHVSLEPSILFNLKLSSEMYLQGQFAYWIPIGGDDLYQGNIFHCHFSLNRNLWHITPNVQLVGQLGFNEWSVLGGNYTGTDFLVGGKPIPISATTGIFSVGPGARLFICDKYDVGVGSAFSFTGDRWAQEVLRVEFRWRF